MASVPLMVASDAEQLALVPPLEPVQLHVHGPEPATEEVEPAVQRLAVGAVLTVVPFELPHTPFVSTGAEQLALVPPLEPVQDQVHGPEPDTLETEPAVQRLLEGAVLTVVPFEVPQLPFIGVGVRLAEQDALVPPLTPAHVHDQGPEPVTLEAEPTVQRLVVGVVLTVVPFALPHVPLVATLPLVGAYVQELMYWFADQYPDAAVKPT